ncbi:MAG: hypothetical protein JWL83_3888 [Actinomycetia bacterium]|nr:hypothetical protein [Actinomycetes bacterium]
MRIADVLHNRLDGIDRLVDVHEGELELASYLGLPEGVEYVHAPGATSDESGVPIDERTLLLDLVGPDPRRHRPLERLTDTLRVLSPGQRAVVLLGYEEGELPLHRVLDLLQQVAYRIVAVVPLGYRHITTALVVQRLTDIERETSVEHNMLLLTDYSARSMRVRLHATEEKLGRLRAAAMGNVTEGAESEDAAKVAQMRSELELLRVEVETLRSDRARLRDFERSTTYQVGRVVVDAMAKPGKKTVKAPADLARIWRRRGSAPRVSITVSESPVAVAPEVPALRTDRLLVPFPAATDADLDGIVTIAGIWPAESERVLAPDARAITLHPNQAATQLRRIDPDLLLVQASAAGPGSSWAALGTPPGLMRDRELASLLDEAAAREVRTVLWFDRPPYLAPGLAALADRFDLVLHERGPWADADDADAFSLGVQLARFGALEPMASTERAVPPAFLGTLDPRLGHHNYARLERVMRAAAGSGLRWFDDGAADELAGTRPGVPSELLGARAGYLVAGERPAAYRRHRAWIAMPPLAGDRSGVQRRTVEQLAAGARLIASHQLFLDGELKTRVFDAASDPQHAIDGALHSSSDATQFAVLRELYGRASTSRWLARLARSASLDVRPALARATTLVLSGVGDPAGPSVASVVLAQRERPAAVVVASNGTSPAEIGGALDALQRAGIAVSIVAGGVADAVATAATPWCAIAEDRDLPAEHLLDLHVVAACTTSPVASLGTSAPGRAPAGSALVRTDALRAGTVALAQFDGALTWEGAPGAFFAYEPNAAGSAA